MSNYLTEAFQKMDLLEGETFGIDNNGIEKLKDFIDDAEDLDFVAVFDTTLEPHAEETEESHIGQEILCCPMCQAKIFKNADEIVVDEEGDLVNVGESCPECFSCGGFKIIGTVAPYEDVKVEASDDVEVKVDGEKVEVKDKEEVEEENKSLKDESLKENKALKESPYLDTQFDGRKSFHNKARITDDGNTLYSYEVKVMEIVDGNPHLTIGEDKLSATTLRHIKEFLKQKGFKAETRSQILRDYGDVEENLDKAQTFPIDSPFDKKEGKHGLRKTQKYPVESPYESRDKKANRDMKESKLFESDKPAATSIEDAQKWVDYDMKRYGKISDKTNSLVRKAGFQIVKDTYGDYEVIAGKYDESLKEKRLARIKAIKESLKKKRLAESSKRDDIDADADDKKEKAKKAFAKAKDDADADKDYKLKKSNLKEPIKLKEDWDWNGDKVKIAEEIVDQYGDKKFITKDEFEEAFAIGVRKHCGVDNVWDVEEFEIDGKKENRDDVETDVRVILGINGYETIFEGEDEGGLKLSESKKERVFESIRKPLGKKAIKESKEDKEVKIFYKEKRDSLGDIIQDELCDGEAKYTLKDNGKWANTKKGIQFSPEAIGVDDLGDGKWQIVAYSALQSKIDKAVELAKRYGKEYETGVAKHLRKGDSKDKFIKIFIEDKDWEDDYHNENEPQRGKQEGTTIKEGMEDISITTDKEVIKIKSTPVEGKETIVPPTEEIKAEVEEQTSDTDVEEVDEESFDNLGESYLKRVYENVDSFKTVRGITRGNKLILEGVIKFKSGNRAKTNFIFEAKDADKNGKVRFTGLNENISKNKSAYTAVGTISNKKLIFEKFNYNYVGKDAKSGKSTRVWGSIK